MPILKLGIQMKSLLRGGECQNADRQKVAFLHIPKCAGSSVNRHLKSHLGSSRSGRALGLNAIDLLNDQFPRPSYEDLRHATFVTGHFGWTDLAGLLSSHFCFTVLRHPARRVLSFYYFCRSLKNNAAHFPVDAARRMSFEQFCQSDDRQVRVFIDNAQARTLADTYTKLDDELAPSWIDIAVKNLSAFHFVTTAAHLNEDLDRICSRIHLPKPRKPIYRNVSRWLPTDMPTVADVERILGPRIAHDNHVYELACRLAAKQRAPCAGSQ